MNPSNNIGRNSGNHFWIWPIVLVKIWISATLIPDSSKVSSSPCDNVQDKEGSMCELHYGEGSDDQKVEMDVSFGSPAEQDGSPVLLLFQECIFSIVKWTLWKLVKNLLVATSRAQLS